MVVIYGFQVFDQIPVISKDGGPAYSGLTSAFYIYQNAFSNGKMGYASAAGVLFIRHCYALFVPSIQTSKEMGLFHLNGGCV